jgi:hypothetical protein
MRLTPIPTVRPHRSPTRRVALTLDSDLGAIILRMIATHSLSAFTPAIGRPGETQPVRGVAPSAPTAARESAGAPQRPLEAVPPQPLRPLPRGSLLDLRV